MSKYKAMRYLRNALAEQGIQQKRSDNGKTVYKMKFVGKNSDLYYINVEFSGNGGIRAPRMKKILQITDFWMRQIWITNIAARGHTVIVEAAVNSNLF